MSAIAPEETVLQSSPTGNRHAGNSPANNSPVSLRLEADTPVSVRLEVDGTCTCRGASTRRPGAYTDTDFGVRH